VNGSCRSGRGQNGFGSVENGAGKVAWPSGFELIVPRRHIVPDRGVEMRALSCVGVGAVALALLGNNVPSRLLLRTRPRSHLSHSGF